MLEFMWQRIVHGCPYLCFCCSVLGRELVNNVQCSGRPGRPGECLLLFVLETVHCLCSACRHVHAGGLSMPVYHLSPHGVSSSIWKRGCMWVCRWCSPPIRLVMSIGLVAFACVGCITAVWCNSLYCMVDSSLISGWGSSCGCWSLCACIVLGHCPGFGECNTVHALHVTYDY